MDNKIVYDKYDWSNIDIKHLKGKIEKTLALIPNNIKTIADIGCGNGVITNVLGNFYDVTAVDRSENALKSVKTKKIVANAENIPLPKDSFDMVFSSELLEHLNDETLAGTVSEIMRLSKKYIFITVPNNENPYKLSIKCPKCGYVYNSSNHLRSFNLKSLEKLFPEFHLVKSFTYGKKIRYYNRGILNLKTKFSPSNSWIPYYWMQRENRRTTCPSCETTFENPYKFNLLASGFDFLNLIISPKKSYWLFALYEKI